VSADRAHTAAQYNLPYCQPSKINNQKRRENVIGKPFDLKERKINRKARNPQGDEL
jgi:hypothetical protein